MCIKVSDVRTSLAQEWDDSSSNSSSEGEYRDSEYRRLKATKSKKPKTNKLQTIKPKINKDDRQPKTAVQQATPIPAAPPPGLTYNQNEMSIIVKPLQEPNNMLHDLGLRPTQTLQQQTIITSRSLLNNTESESIVCSPQIMFNIKSEPMPEIDHPSGNPEDDIEEEEIEIDHEFKMEIVEDAAYDEQLFAVTRDTMRRPPSLIPLACNKANVQKEAGDHKRQNEDGDLKLKQLLQQLMKSDSGNGGSGGGFGAGAGGGGGGSHMPTFVLRNPRGNQQRTYTTDNLWAALMDVKSGESIYRCVFLLVC